MALYRIQGRVADDTTSQPLKGVTVQMLAKRVKTDDRGRYVLDIDLDDGVIADLNFSLQGYEAETVKPFRQNGKVKRNIRVVRLVPTETSLEKEIPRVPLSDTATDEIIDGLTEVDPRQSSL